jgi:hypothetical protein
MFINRTTIRVKPFKADKLVELLKESETIVKPPHGSLIYLPYVGQQNVVIQDFKFENLTELEEFWGKMWSNPDILALVERMSEVIESEIQDEILRLVE